MLRFYRWLKEETISVIPAILYFGIAFNLVYFTRSLALGPGYAQHTSYLKINIAALLVGKVLLIANSLPFINLFPKKPLIYNIIWKFFLYNLCVFIVELTDIFCGVALKNSSVALGLQRIKLDLVSPIFWSTQLTLWLLFLFFVVFTEFFRRLGRDKVLKILFGRD